MDSQSPGGDAVRKLSKYLIESQGEIVTWELFTK